MDRIDYGGDPDDWESTALTRANASLDNLYRVEQALEAELERTRAEIVRIRETRDVLQKQLATRPDSASGSQDRLADIVHLRPMPAAHDPWSPEFWPTSGPTTAQAIVTVLREASRPMGPRDLAEELARRGWLPDGTDPVRVITSALYRLHHNPACPLERVTQGFYQATG